MYKREGNTAKQQEIYQKIGGRLTASTAKEIEELKQRKDAVLEEEAQKEDEYAQGKISVDEYMKYRDEYHMMNDKNEAIDMVYEKYETARKNGSWMIFDGYYDQLFRMDRTQWGLMLSVFLVIVLLVCCEPKELLATISVTREGRRGLWGAKLRTILMATLIFVILFAVEELMVIRQFSPAFLFGRTHSKHFLFGRKAHHDQYCSLVFVDAVTSSSKYNDLCSRDL